MRKNNQSNPKNSSMEENSEFNFCKLCKINHNQGRRHNFYPRHKNSLSSLLSHFSDKFSHIKISLRNPSFSFSSESAVKYRIWCIFCEIDIVECDSTFTSGNSIKHFASEEHLKNLKHFLWKYGGGFDKLDSFMISQADFAKWEKKCKGLKSEPASSDQRYFGPSQGQSSDIRPNFEIMNSFDNVNNNNDNNISFIDSCDAKIVMPLQYDTNENHQVLHLDISGVGKVGCSPMQLTGSSHTAWDSLQHGQSAYMGPNQYSHFSNGSNFFTDGISVADVPNNRSFVNRGHATEGFQTLTQISHGKREDVKGNVHSLAPPPWLEGFEAQDNHGLSRESRVNSTEKNSRKSSKLNPKRVGAAWAERRKLEMEMEKRGEMIAGDFDSDWLPNFGRVWQSGTRKESMKEFKKEKLKPASENQAEPGMQLCPYISKRMRQDTCEVSREGVQNGATNSKIVKGEF